MTRMVPKEQVNWEFFLKKFKENFIIKHFIEQMKKLLELKEGRITVFEYEREFIRLRYAKDLVPDEEGLCIIFEGGLN